MQRAGAIAQWQGTVYHVQVPPSNPRTKKQTNKKSMIQKTVDERLKCKYFLLLLLLLNSLRLGHESSQEGVYKGVWPCANKTLFTKLVNLAQAPQFTDPFCRKRLRLNGTDTVGQERGEGQAVYTWHTDKEKAYPSWRGVQNTGKPATRENAFLGQGLCQAYGDQQTRQQECDNMSLRRLAELEVKSEDGFRVY